MEAHKRRDAEKIAKATTEATMAIAQSRGQCKNSHEAGHERLDMCLAHYHQADLQLEKAKTRLCAAEEAVACASVMGGDDWWWS